MCIRDSTLTVTLGEGTTPNVAIDDTLPAGMVYLNDASIASADAGLTFGTGLSATLNAGVLELRLDEVVVPGTGGDDAALETGTFTIEYTARVANVVGNQSGTALVNDADASADGVSADVDNQVTVTVTEPELSVSKTVLDGAGGALEAGDTVRYQIEVTHAGGSLSLIHI